MPTLKLKFDKALAASKMTGAKRRTFEAEMALQYCEGDPLQAESIFGWSRRTVALGLAEAHAQQAPTFRPILASTRLTATAAVEAWRAQGYSEAQGPAPSTMAEVLNRMGFRLRKGMKAKPNKKIAEPDVIFDNI
jgi:hypothetical protein